MKTIEVNVNPIKDTISFRNKTNLKSPVLLIIFDKPEKTNRVFNEIRKVKPKKLYISSDGPRNNIIGEIYKVTQCRNIISKVDWDCEVFTNYCKNNSGSAKKGVSIGINWFFENENEGIILESDCLPTKSFFYFCDSLLNYYRYDSRIMHISGNNFHKTKTDKNESYYFSKIPFIWGWATWKRAWIYYDINLKTLPTIINNNKFTDIFDTNKMRKYWIKRLERVYESKIDTWDYQWLYTILTQNGLCITPNNNLVTNIGFDSGAIHTKIDSHGYLKYKASNIENIFINDFMVPNKQADICNFKNVIDPSYFKKLYIKYLEFSNNLKTIIKGVLKIAG